MDQEQTQPITQSHSLKIRVLATGLTVLILAIATASVLVVDFAGWNYLHWASKHPVLSAKYDPHHWVARIAALAILCSMGHIFVSALHQPLATFRAWRRVFVALPWERRESERREADRPAV